MRISTNSRPNKGPLFLYTGVPAVVTSVLWLLSPYDVSISEAAAALILTWVPWALYQRWKEGDQQEIPLFVLITGMFWLAYALPLFLSSRDIGLIDGRHHLSEDSLRNSLYLAVFGVLALIAGSRIAEWSRWAPATSVDISGNPSRWTYLRAVLVSGILLRLFVSINAWGPEGRQLIVNLQTIVPTVTFAILFRYCLRGKGSGFDRFLVLVYVATALVLGISSGWVGNIVGLGLICAAVYIYERHELPFTAALVILSVILFLQPAKGEFRSRFWLGDSSASHLERITFWVNHSWRMWDTAFTDPNGDAAKDLADNTLSRFSLLQQTANVMERTPEVVPYQYGHLYSYVGVTLIPRFVWPGKPSMNDANRWYQVSYRLTSPKGLESVSIAVGTLAESYINFGWVGPLLVMVPLGVFLGLFERLFLRHNAGVLLNSLGVVLLPGFIGIESQLAQYVAGLVQQVTIAVIILIPELEFRHQRRLAGWPIRTVIPTALSPKDLRHSEQKS